MSLPNVPIQWFVMGQPVVSSPKYTISMDKGVHTLRLEQARKIDAGQVKAVFYQLESKATLLVTGMRQTLIFNNLIYQFRRYHLYTPPSFIGLFADHSLSNAF